MKAHGTLGFLLLIVLRAEALDSELVGGHFSETIVGKKDVQDNEHLTGGQQMWSSECCPSSGIPPAPRILLIGQTGVGKSTLGNRLLGKKPGMCASSNSLLNPSSPEFGVGHDMNSHTNETAWISGRWMGIETNPCVTILDTPGIGDTKGRDCEHAKQIAQVVRNLGDIQGFILVMKGNDNRFSDFLKEQMNLFNEMFGQSFWHNLVIEMSFWKHNPNDILDRKEDQKMDEQKKESEWNHEVQKLFNSVPEIPVIFIDPVFKEERAKENETKIFRKETSKLWDIINTNQSYACDSLTCTDVGFTEGIPTLVTLDPVLSRVGGKLALTWQIWFGDCGNQTGIRSYSIEFTNSKSQNVQIFSMIDKQQKKQEVFIAKEPSKNLGFPSTGIVMDKCSKTTLDNECDNNNSKHKMVTLIFNKIDDENFGNYSVVNAVGRSKEVEVRKVIDGTWGEWSMYGLCSKTCFSLKENRWGEKVRHRECTEPQNGGNPCTGRDREVMQCAHGPGESGPRNCIGVFGEWSIWGTCQRTCGGGVMKRRRHCGEAACKIDKAGRGDEDEKACNTQECPVPSVYGEWSQWKCKEVCHNPYERHLTREVRTRRCIAKYPKHEAANCNLMTHTREESQSSCTNIEQCPALFEITTKVCGVAHSGTDDNVFMKFRNGVKGSCMTNWLDEKGNDFETSSYQSWRNPFLFSCSKDFRPAEGLQVQVHMDSTLLKVCFADDLQLCKIEAKFGTGTENGASKWIWSAKSTMKGEWNTGHHGCWLSYIGWLDMCKECTTSQKQEMTTDEKRHCCY